MCVRECFSFSMITSTLTMSILQAPLSHVTQTYFFFQSSKCLSESLNARMVAWLLLLALFGGWTMADASQDALEDYQEPAYHLSKRDLEFNQYVPAYRLRGEPSCEELRAMWRYSKREARRATSTNQLPRTRPYRYGRLRPFAAVGSYGPRVPVYGTVTYDNRKHHLYRPPSHNALSRLRAMIGPRRHGAFSELRSTLNKEREKGESPAGQYNNLRGMLLKEIQDEKQTLQNTRDGGTISQRRDPTMPLIPSQDRREGFTGALLPGNPKLAYYQQQPHHQSSPISKPTSNYVSNTFLISGRVTTILSICLYTLINN